MAGELEPSPSTESPQTASTPRPLPLSSSTLTVRIGVTGHRTLSNPDVIRHRINEVLDSLNERLSKTPHEYRVISPLAEGADRLVAECVLARKGKLDVVLPMPKDEYVETFSETRRLELIEEFERLLSQADEMTTLSKAASRKEAYMQVGRYVVENCDVLIAIWDGKKARGKGGTAEIVRFARERDVPLFWISPRSGELRAQLNVRDFTRQFQDCRRRFETLSKHAREAQLDPAILLPLNKMILPRLARASQLARRYQAQYLGFTTAAYYISACAVGTAAFLSLIFTGASDWWFSLELIEIVCVTWLVWPPARERRLRKWIDYRYLAERVRASCFLYLAGLKEEIAAPPPDFQLSWLPHNWVIAVIGELSKSLPSERQQELLRDPVAAARVAKFIRSAWIDAQRRYYSRAGKDNERKDKRHEHALWILLAATLLVTTLHVILGVWFDFGRSSLTSRLLSSLAVTLPAFASAVAGVSVFQHYNRNAERYESMSRHLMQLSGEKNSHERISVEAIQQLVREADRAMSHEHQGWRAVFGIRLPGPG